MKSKIQFKLFIVIVISIFTMMAACKPKTEEKAPTAKETVMDKPTYQLFSTQNMWNFIKLNTVNGKMWLVQYSVDGDESRFQVPLNENSLLSGGQPEIKGRFTLTPTQNMWNFILLDQVDGKQWQVQWSTSRENMIVIPID